MRHADIKTTNDYYTDLRLHDLDLAVNQISLPVIEEHRLAATGTDMALSNCHGNGHVSVHDSVLLGASGCDELTTSRGVKPKDKTGVGHSGNGKSDPVGFKSGKTPHRHHELIMQCLQDQPRHHYACQ